MRIDRTIGLLSFVLATLGVFAVPGAAQDPVSAEETASVEFDEQWRGRWLVRLETARPMVMLFDVTPSGIAASAPAAPAGMQVSKLERRDEVVRFLLAIGSNLSRISLQQKFDAEKQPIGLAGELRPMRTETEPMGDIRIPLVLERWTPPRSLPDVRNYGSELEIPGATLDVVLAFARDESGTLFSVMDIPAQGIEGFPLVVDVDEPEKRVMRAFIGVPATISLDRVDEDTWSGTFEQGGMEIDVSFDARGIVGSSRPQTPKPPFPYESYETTVAHPDGHVLAGTLNIPRGRGPFPAVVFATGSGPQDRDETILGHKPFAVLADALARAGVASLRCDDRGFGASTGDYAAATVHDFASDVALQVKHLSTIKAIDFARVGIIGHSEGGLVAPIVAAGPAGKDVSFLVLIAGLGVDGGSIMTHQTELIYRLGTDDDALIRPLIAAHKTLMTAMRNDADREELRPLVAELLRTQLAIDLGPDSPRIDPLILESLEGHLSTIDSEPMRVFVKSDPQPYLSKVSVPVLAIFGELDLQVDPKQNAAPMQSALERGGSSVTIRVVPGANHLLQQAETGSLVEYGQISTTMDPAVVEEIVNWVRMTVGR